MTSDGYVIGIDYGTQSARAQVTAVKDGQARGEAVYPYPHGVMSRQLPDGTPLEGGDWSLAHPEDYWNALTVLVPEAMKAAGVCARQIVGLSIAATAYSMLPVDQNLVPLCFQPKFESQPHAYLKLWKHHRAESDARLLTAAARQRDEAFLSDYGGTISSEWAFPKMMEVLREAPDVYEAADCFMQFSDWLESRLTGRLVRDGGIAAFKSLYDKRSGYPSQAYLSSVNPMLVDMVENKLRGQIFWPGERAGVLLPAMAGALGLLPGTAIGSGHTDAHAAALGAGICRSGDYLVVLGTSSVTHFLHKQNRQIQGISATIRDGLLPKLTCYTAGQPCVGDMLEWFVRLTDCQASSDTYRLLEEKAALLSPAQSGLIALDWWNGNRSILANSQLSGLIVGLTLDTKPWEIYRAMMEAVAFGQRMIWDQYQKNELSPERVVLCGGIAMKSPLLCQIMADVLGVPVEISSAQQATALGAAMCAATAAGEEKGGYACLSDAVIRMQSHPMRRFEPIDDHVPAYQALFEKYRYLYEAFGMDAPWFMESLKRHL